MNARLKDGIVALLNKNNVNGIKQQVPDLAPFFEFYCILSENFKQKKSQFRPPSGVKSRTPKAQRK